MSNPFANTVAGIGNPFASGYPMANLTYVPPASSNFNDFSPAVGSWSYTPPRQQLANLMAGGRSMQDQNYNPRWAEGARGWGGAYGNNQGSNRPGGFSSGRFGGGIGGGVGGYSRGGLY